MATIVIKDLELNRELDKKALTSLRGGDYYGDYYYDWTGGYSGWIGGQYSVGSNFDYGSLFSSMSFSDILGYSDRLIGRMSNNPFLWNSPTTALNMYNSGYYW